MNKHGHGLSWEWGTFLQMLFTYERMFLSYSKYDSTNSMTAAIDLLDWMIL